MKSYQPRSRREGHSLEAAIYSLTLTPRCSACLIEMKPFFQYNIWVEAGEEVLVEVGEEFLVLRRELEDGMGRCFFKRIGSSH